MKKVLVLLLVFYSASLADSCRIQRDSQFSVVISGRLGEHRLHPVDFSSDKILGFKFRKEGQNSYRYSSTGIKAIGSSRSNSNPIASTFSGKAVLNVRLVSGVTRAAVSAPNSTSSKALPLLVKNPRVNSYGYSISSNGHLIGGCAENRQGKLLPVVWDSDGTPIVYAGGEGCIIGVNNSGRAIGYLKGGNLVFWNNKRSFVEIVPPHQIRHAHLVALNDALLTDGNLVVGMGKIQGLKHNTGFLWDGNQRISKGVIVARNPDGSISAFQPTGISSSGVVSGRIVTSQKTEGALYLPHGEIFRLNHGAVQKGHGIIAILEAKSIKGNRILVNASDSKGSTVGLVIAPDCSERNENEGREDDASPPFQDSNPSDTGLPTPAVVN